MDKYILTFKDSNDYLAELVIEGSHNVEGIIRGLIHSGFQVTIKEIPREKTNHSMEPVPDTMAMPTGGRN